MYKVIPRAPTKKAIHTQKTLCFKQNRIIKKCFNNPQEIRGKKNRETNKKVKYNRNKMANLSPNILVITLKVIV